MTTTTTDRRTFARYLADQTDRDDPIGDLARDVQADDRISNRFSYRQLGEHLLRCGVSPEAAIAYTAVGHEWRAKTGKRLR